MSELTANPSGRDDWLSLCAGDADISNYTSQRGEDRIMQKLFAIITPRNKWCVEFGATDGRHLSNTWYWINKQGWHSVQIEGARDWHLSLRTRDRDSFDALQRRYKKNERVICRPDWVGTAGDGRLDIILAKTSIPPDFDLLSIDVDGLDYDIWQSLKEYSPRVVVIEHNKTIPIEVSFHSDRGSSLRALSELGQQKGYELVAANDLNGIFVRRELFAQLGINNNAPERLWRGQEPFRMHAQLEREGGVSFHGPKRLRWLRGADGTLAGQIKAGRYIAIRQGQETIAPAVPGKPRTYLSGLVRWLLYSI